MRTAIRTPHAALALLLPMSAALVAQPALAQQRAVVAAQPTVQSMVLNSTAGLAPGAVLRVQVIATPGGRNGSLSLGDGARMALTEQSPGRYVGTHVITPNERIDPRDRITARIAWHDRTVAQHFDFPAGFATPALPAPAIADFDVQPQGRLVAGRELRFRLRGAPGARADVDIPGVVRNIQLQETRPGVYEGRYTIRQRDDLRAFDEAVATLRRGGERTTARVAFREARDQRPPQVTDVTPNHGERVDGDRRERISARFHDDGSGVDPASVRLRVDGVDVTRNARISEDGVHYRDNLRRGRHTAELVVRDHAGNASRTAWSFRVL